MERNEVRNYQLAQLELLKTFDGLCDDLGIRYFLVFGSLLGAVRHKGFIPWDADTDVALFRKDYEKLKDYFMEHASADLFYEHYETEKNHISPHAILRIKNTRIIYNVERSSRYPLRYDGVFIDLFPIDSVSESKAEQKRQVRIIKSLKRIITLKAAPTYGGRTGTLKRAAKTVVSVILSPISLKTLNRQTDKVMQKYSDENSKHVAILTDPHVFEKQLFLRECFGEPQRLRFEDFEVCVPNQYEDFLKIRYGDYNVLPPEEERWTYLEKTIRAVEYGSCGCTKE